MRRLLARFDGRVLQLKLPEEPVTLGSDEDNDLIVPFPGVSRRHLAVLPEGTGLRLVDLDSKNGIVRGGSRHAEYLLQYGDEVRIGRAYLRLEELSTSDTTIAVPIDSSPSGFEAGNDEDTSNASDTAESGPEQPLVFPDGMVEGRSVAMRELLERVRHCAPSQARVLLQGESGVGKELIAKTLHLSSRRASGPYVAFNCAAIPQGLFESILFGHERGAFTGAVSTRKGLFETAAAGTVFLDEISEVPPDSQAKLLRVLQEGEVLRVGSAQARPVDIRVIAASNRDLEEQVASGALRADLYYRLNVVSLTIPPLRDCREDIPALAGAFAERFAHREGKHVRGITQRALAKLLAYAWPGNVRELENQIESAVLLCSDGGSVESQHLSLASEPAGLESDEAGPPREEPGGFTTWDRRLADLKLDAVREALLVAGGTKLRAAKLLGVARGTLDRWLEELDLDHE